MKSVRIAYSKTGDARFISHLDMNRFWARALRKTGLPLWFTEGFNPHIYTRFALPLSLGFESNYEIMDFRLLDDSMPAESVAGQINKFTPADIKVIAAWEPKLDYGDITYARYSVNFIGANADVKEKLDAYLSQNQMILSKKNKKGNFTEFDCMPYISGVKTCLEGDILTLKITLPAGNTKTVNPSLIIAAFLEKYGLDCEVSVTREMLLDGNKNIFR